MKDLNTGFLSCEEIAGSLQYFYNRWCKREHVESNASNNWKINIVNIIDSRISFYCNNLDMSIVCLRRGLSLIGISACLVCLLIRIKASFIH